jgi:hypothetical protein
MNRTITASLTILALTTTGHLAFAQDKMAKPMGKEKTYTGCIEAGTATGTYSLTHATADMSMGKDAMMKKDDMKKDTMGKAPMGNDAMMTMAIESKSVDLSKHVGHKVSVTGTESAMAMAKPDAMGKAMPALSVASIKMVAASCGM